MSFHARLSASSFDRIMACPGSAGVGGGATSIHAATGTFAHTLASQVLEGKQDPKALLGLPGHVEGFDIVCDEEMVEAIMVYLTHCMLANECDRLPYWVEMPLLEPLQKIDPDLGGTADFVAYDEVKKKLTVVDFKYGSGVYVKAPGNTQLKIYALGAMLYVKRPVEVVEVVIVQPRFKGSKPVRSDTFNAADLIEFAADIKEAADRTRLPGAERHGGKHCQFCPVEEDCPMSMKFVRRDPVKPEDFDIINQGQP